MIPPRISIVTPSFNQGQYLEECIDSVLGQNYPNLEYVIMDGGSTDESVEIIKKYEKYLAYWQSKPDGGQYAAINEGFKKTSGEIMAWLNSDDKYHASAFFKAACIFSKHKEAEWITGRPTVFDKGGNIVLIFDYLPVFSREKYLKDGYCNPHIQQESTFWRRSLWEKSGGIVRADLDYAGDMELWTRFFRHAQLFTADAVLGGYRVHGNQKAILHLDKYNAEADKILQEERAGLKTAEYREFLPAVDPVAVRFDDMKDFAATLQETNPHTVVRPSFDLELGISYFLKKMEDEKEHKLNTIQALEAQLQKAENARDQHIMALDTEIDVLKSRIRDLTLQLETAGAQREKDLAADLGKLAKPIRFIRRFLSLCKLHSG